MSIDFTTFDADNHYYEATDAFTRYLDKGMARRTMQWAEIDGRQRLLVAGAVNRFIPNPTFDPVAKPGSLDEYFRGRNPRGENIAAIMDAQGVDGCFMFPTLGVGMEEALADDPEAAVAAFHAFNRWLDDDWGYAYHERIFAAPMIPLVDVDAAVAELDEVLAKDARIVCIKSGPAVTRDGRVSPGDARFDPFWARVDEAGYNRYVDDWEQVGTFRAFAYSPLRIVLSGSRAPYETMAALVCQGVFDRFPRVRVASIEAGADWVPDLLKKLKKVYGQSPAGFTSDPVATFRTHVWVAPFYEDDLAELKDLIGLDHILFGSDWPHAEGLAVPATFADDLRRNGFDEGEIRVVMGDNGRVLTERLP
jgi:predicted TIM-barrel fold metal-dependent hydrolase